MDRAIASGAIGREFESLRAHQISPDPSQKTSSSPIRQSEPILQHLWRQIHMYLLRVIF